MLRKAFSFLVNFIQTDYIERKAAIRGSQNLMFEYSISRVLFRKAVIIIYLDLQLPASSSDTTREAQRAASSLSYLVLLRMGFT